eukprot:5324832-Pyramimonas_sp.AAC.1
MASPEMREGTPAAFMRPLSAARARGKSSLANAAAASGFTTYAKVLPSDFSAVMYAALGPLVGMTLRFRRGS